MSHCKVVTAAPVHLKIGVLLLSILVAATVALALDPFSALTSRSISTLILSQTHRPTAARGLLIPSSKSGRIQLPGVSETAHLHHVKEIVAFLASRIRLPPADRALISLAGR